MNPLQVIGTVFSAIFLTPVVNLLVVIIHGLELLHLPGALGLAILILTVLIRLLVWPFMSTQMKSAKKMADIKPHLDELKKKHKDDKQAFAKAQMELYKQHGINPAGGCLPTIIQLLVIIALYQSILSLFDGGGLAHLNGLLYPFVPHLTQIPSPDFLGFKLTDKPSDFAKIGVVVLAIPVITAALQFVQSRMMTPKPLTINKNDSPKEVKEKGSTEDAMMAMQSQMTYIMPLMIGYFAFTFPIGIALYWNTFSIIGIIQQYRLGGWGGMAGLIGQLRKLPR